MKMWVALFVSLYFASHSFAGGKGPRHDEPTGTVTYTHINNPNSPAIQIDPNSIASLAIPVAMGINSLAVGVNAIGTFMNNCNSGGCGSPPSSVRQHKRVFFSREEYEHSLAQQALLEKAVAEYKARVERENEQKRIDAMSPVERLCYKEDKLRQWGAKEDTPSQLREIQIARTKEHLGTITHQEIIFEKRIQKAENRLSPETREYLENTVIESKKSVYQMRDLSRNPNIHLNTTIETSAQFAVDTVISINQFLAGVTEGVYQAFLSPVQAAQIIYNNPELLAHLANNLMKLATDGYYTSYVTREFVKRTRVAVSRFFSILQYGSAHDIGQAGGRLAGDLLVAAAATELKFAPLDTVVKTYAQESFAKYAVQNVFQKLGQAGSGHEPRLFDYIYQQAREVQNLTVMARGNAIPQRLEAEFLHARHDVLEGATLYKIGERNRGRTYETAQFWSLENPLHNPNYAREYGLPETGAGQRFLETGTLKPGSRFITREAEAVGNNPGGQLEVVVEPGSIDLISHEVL